MSVPNGQGLSVGGHMAASARLHEVTQRGQSAWKGWLCPSWSAPTGYNCSRRRQVWADMQLTGHVTALRAFWGVPVRWKNHRGWPYALKSPIWNTQLWIRWNLVLWFGYSILEAVQYLTYSSFLGCSTLTFELLMTWLKRAWGQWQSLWKEAAQYKELRYYLRQLTNHWSYLLNVSHWSIPNSP